MPVAVSYPGVYIHEVPSGVRTITGVATSIAAFVGYTAKGPDNRARRIFGFPDFVRVFGGLAPNSELSYAVQQFFDNGGTDAYVVRVPGHDAKAASLVLRDKVSGGSNVLEITARSTGTCGNKIMVDVDYDGAESDDEFNLTITDTDAGTVEAFRKVSMTNTKDRFVVTVVNDEDSGSRLVLVKNPGAKRPAQNGTIGKEIDVDANGKPKSIDTAKNLQLKLSTDFPKPPKETIKDKQIVVFRENDAAPGSVAALCRQLERRVNADMPAGGSVACSVVKDGVKQSIRVVATIPDAYDAVLTFDAGDAGSEHANIDSVLRLGAGTANVSHYWLGTPRTAAHLGMGKPTAGTEGDGLPDQDDLIGDPAKFTGIYALDKVDLFNILCIPDATRAAVGSPTTTDDKVKTNSIYDKAIIYCDSRRAFLLIDAPPEYNDVEQAIDWKSRKLSVRHKNGAAYFPRLKLPDPLNKYQLRTFAPCGVVAGLYARIDASRGVWKAPAGVEATLAGVQGVAYKMSDPENGALNPLGLNCFRIFPIYGAICWGARTLVGADAEGSEWKYVPVRRFALFLEESLFRGTKWVVFEPNDEPLWAQIRLNIGAFMHTLFRQGAFQGKTPQEAYFVKCDRETTTQDDINRGVVNIVVGFAPLKPAEFVILHIQQMAGQIQT